MDDADIRRLLLKFPRIIEYRTERTLRPRIDFLLQQGVPQADLSKVRCIFGFGPVAALNDGISSPPHPHMMTLCALTLSICSQTLSPRRPHDLRMPRIGQVFAPQPVDKMAELFQV